MLDLLGALGLVLIIVGVLMALHVIGGGVLFGVVVAVVGLLCLGGFGPRVGAGRGRYRP
jgi:hypothetical protein